MICLYRCRYLAHSYGNNNEWANALALFDRSVSHAVVAKEHLLDCVNHDKAEVANIEQLIQDVASDKSLIKTRAYLESLEKVCFKFTYIGY